MKNLRPLTLIAIGLGLLVGSLGCKKKETETAFSFTLSPTITTALNITRKTCANVAAKAFDPTIDDPITGAPGAAKFQKMTISWKNTTSNLTIYAMRITGTTATGPIDITMSSADFWSFVWGPGLDTSVYCKFCKIAKSVGDVPWTVTINDDTKYLNYDGSATSFFGCGPMLSGLPVPKDQVGEVNISLKATLLAYSEDDAGGVNNEYASFPFTVKFQAPPQ